MTPNKRSALTPQEHSLEHRKTKDKKKKKQNQETDIPEPAPSTYYFAP